MAYKSHLYFFSIYLSHYIKYPFAPFHYKMFEITENKDIRHSVLTAFRDSGKSTINTLSFPIWAVNGCLEKKFVLIVSQTQVQAKSHLSNIRKELEGNELLKNDIGPFHEEDDEWGASSLVLSNQDARITIASTEQSIRGIRHGPHRPDLVICDDVEDLNSVKTKEGRNKTWEWFTGEVLPIGSTDTKYLVVGNLLHEDSLIMRLEKLIGEGKYEACYLKIPIYDKNRKIAWPGKYPKWEDIKKQRSTVPSRVTWYREYMLSIISDEERVVHPEWIKYYDELPSVKENNFRFVINSVDLAISEKSSADCTAIVSAYVFGRYDKMSIYILPNPINKKMNFPNTIEVIKQLYESQRNEDLVSRTYIEDVGYQGALSQQLKKEGVSTFGVKIYGSDKRSRLSQTTSWIESGKILFPKKGAEILIDQLKGFGTERYDDLVDAFSMLVLEMMKDNSREVRTWGRDSDIYRLFHDLR